MRFEPMPATTTDVIWIEVSDWCRHGFESHSQPLLLIFLGLKKAHGALSSVFSLFMIWRF